MSEISSLFRCETGKPEISDGNKGCAKKIRIFNWSIRDIIRNAFPDKFPP